MAKTPAPTAPAPSERFYCGGCETSHGLPACEGYPAPAPAAAPKCVHGRPLTVNGCPDCLSEALARAKEAPAPAPGERHTERCAVNDGHDRNRPCDCKPPAPAPSERCDYCGFYAHDPNCPGCGKHPPVPAPASRCARCGHAMGRLGICIGCACPEDHLLKVPASAGPVLTREDQFTCRCAHGFPCEIAALRERIEEVEGAHETEAKFRAEMDEENKALRAEVEEVRAAFTDTTRQLTYANAEVERLTYAAGELNKAVLHAVTRANKAEAEVAEVRLALTDTVEQLFREKARADALSKAVRWALGEGDSNFGEDVPPNAKQYWWRAELRERAFGATAKRIAADALKRIKGGEK